MNNERQMQDAATTVGATGIVSTSRANAPQPMAPTENPRKFAGIDFKRCKDEAIDAFRQYKTKVENPLEKKIKMIRSDRVGEYESPFAEICVENGVIHQTTTLYSPQSNGIVERKNHTLKEMMNALLISSGLLQNLLGKAILIANRILNRVPHKATPSCTVLLDILESSLRARLPETFAADCKLQDTLSKAVDLLPELCKLADAPREAIISYRRPLLHQCNLDIQTTIRIQRDLPSFFSIVELNHSIFNSTGREVAASKHGKPDILGTPIETASLQFGLALGGDLPAERQAGKLIKVDPFNYTNKRMGVVLDLAEGGIVDIKEPVRPEARESVVLSRSAGDNFGLALGGDLPAERQAGKLIKVDPFNYTNKRMGVVLDLAEGGIVDIKEPVRPEARESVVLSRSAGDNV
ncbi:hypothetical protein CQW23_04942 [Capsicum baccatum]|uniref:Integrase catalytic domain-containing protein n=1 Tax=Capsicum baccatum TaxID=33114 RepID=A0A2G2XG27_CAPBA|nr:hypothetical protein CQW23_04942 [Capsicum baccatum]